MLDLPTWLAYHASRRRSRQQQTGWTAAHVDRQPEQRLSTMGQIDRWILDRFKMLTAYYADRVLSLMPFARVK